MILRLLAFSALALLSGCATSNKKKADYRLPESRVGDTRTVRFASTDGRFVGLSDGSLWNIDWRHAGRVKTWRAGESVRVRDTGGGGSFPYQLITPSGATASARYGKKLD